MGDYQAVPSSIPAPPPSYHEQQQTVDPEAGDLQAGYENVKKNVIDCDAAIRMGFVRKVYSILAAQIGFTTIVSAFCMYNQTVKSFIQAKWVVL